MWLRFVISVVAICLIPSTPLAAADLRVSVECDTVAVRVEGGSDDVTARLIDIAGRERSGLVVERSYGEVAIILAVDAEPGERIEVSVPREVDLRVNASNGGNVVVRNVRGELEVVNSNAGITFEGVAGTVLATTSNGPIVATIIDVDERLPMSFLTSNASIDVTLPAALNANLVMESDRDELVSEFELKPPAGESLVSHVRRGGRLRSIVCGSIGHGGQEIRMRTENASVTIRRVGNQ